MSLLLPTRVVFTAAEVSVCLYLCSRLCVLCQGSPLECEICPLLRSDPFEMKMPPSVVILLKETVCIFTCVCVPQCALDFAVKIRVQILCTGCGPHGIRQSFQSSTQFFFSVSSLHPKCADFTSPVSLPHLTRLVLLQSVSGRLQT